MHATVARQPNSVRELAEHLFTQYQFEAGQIHLAGCRFENRPFLRLTYFQPTAPTPDGQVSHCYASMDGQLLSPAYRTGLELDNAVPMTGRSARLEEKVLRQWADVVTERCARRGSNPAESLLAATLIWCKYAVGKLSFSNGQSSVELPFSGWAKFFCDRRVVPPPYTCPLTGMSSYHLAVTDEGQITVAEAIATCAESGRRVLDIDLTACSVTGRRVLAEFLDECPVSGEPAIRTEFQNCGTCRQRVSPAMISNGQCRACNELAAAAADDPRLERIRDRFPKLKQWRGWRISETKTVYVVMASQVWQRLLLVLGKDSLNVLLVASRPRLSKTWTEATAQQQSDWLGS